MFQWLREFFQLRYEFREKNLQLTKEYSAENRVYETLIQQLESANYERDKLIARILEKPEIPKTEPVPVMVPPRAIPWNVRRQMLEREDREKARIMREAPKPDAEKADVAALEKELDDAAKEREAQAESGRKEQTS